VCEVFDTDCGSLEEFCAVVLPAGASPPREEFSLSENAGKNERGIRER